MKILLSLPLANQYSRALVTTLSESDLLAQFNTTISTNASSKWVQLLPEKIRREWLRRAFPLSPDRIYAYPYRELIRILSLRIRIKQLIKHEVGWASIDAVYQNFDEWVSRRLSNLVETQSLDAVYATEDGALSTFKQAKCFDLKCIYDLPIAYWATSRKLLSEEADRLPQWAETLVGIQDSDGKLERKTQEFELADTIVVPSQFVKESLPVKSFNKQVIIAPFGSPTSLNQQATECKKPDLKRPLRILFVGSMSQRKGLADLFSAMKLLNRSDVELIVMGLPQAPMFFYNNEFPGFRYKPTASHDEVLALMHSCDVFCLPSIVEGRALVMQEAMSQGLPLIITPNTGGEDLIQEGKTGFLIPIRSPAAIAEKITWFLENRSAIPEMGRMAQLHAAQYTWQSYGAKIVESLDGNQYEAKYHRLHQ